jgi:hypothetical protein
MLLLLTPFLIHPAAAGHRSPAAADQSEAASGARGKTPTVDFCEMVRRPQLYFDKPVRLTATYEMGVEASYLMDVRCVPGPGDRIGTRYVNAGERQPDIRSRYGSQARVTVVGILRNSSRRGFAWYRYRFDIMRFEDVSREDISRLINAYTGALEEGMTYRAAARGDRRFGLSLVPPPRVPHHTAVRVEWTNLGEFPALKRLRNSSRRRQIVFRIVSDHTARMAEGRWNRTLGCQIIIVESGPF